MNIIEKIRTPVIIIKIKVDGKFITKSFIEQIPWGVYVYHLDYDYENPKIRYGISKVPREWKKTDEQFFIDGTLLGYVNIKAEKLAKTYVESYRDVEDKYGYGYQVEENYKGKFYYIIWYDEENNLKRGYIDEWTAEIADIKLRQIYI